MDSVYPEPTRAWPLAAHAGDLQLMQIRVCRGCAVTEGRRDNITVAQYGTATSPVKTIGICIHSSGSYPVT